MLLSRSAVAAIRRDSWSSTDQSDVSSVDTIDDVTNEFNSMLEFASRALLDESGSAGAGTMSEPPAPTSTAHDTAHATPVTASGHVTGWGEGAAVTYL